MPRSRLTFFWPLRLIAVLSLVGPALFFSYDIWQSRRAIEAQAEDRIEHSLDVLQEHALKGLQTVERSISEANEVLRNLTDEQIRAAESDFFLRLKRTQQALPQIEAIWAFDREGRPLVSSTIMPVPQTLNNSDRSYFAAQRQPATGTFVSEVIRARVGSLSFFVISGRRLGVPADRFNGVLAVSVMPEHFSEFYRKLTRGQDSFALIRADGTFLARYPELRFDAGAAPSELTDAIRSHSESGRVTAVSSIDNIQRRIGYRKVPGFPVYVASAIETAAIAGEFRTGVIVKLAVGLPAALAIFALALYSLRRAQGFHDEVLRREAVEVALKQAQRLEAIGQLTGGVAHDFNNLLMVVAGNAGRLKRHLPADERAQRAVEAIEIAVRRGADLTRQLLSFSRRQTHEAKVIDLSERLPAVQAMLQSSLRGDIMVEVVVASNIWHTKVDISEFELALLNLAVNARDAMTAGGRLTLAARNASFVEPNTLGLSGDFVAVSVQDTGIGIPADLLNRVFEPFFTTKDVGKGTGLGLSQVYGFAQQAGGLAVVVSEVGRGTTVTLYLPRSQEPSEPENVDLAVQPRLREHVHVLLVEDNPQVAEVTSALLEELGYTVTLAPDAAAGTKVLQNPQQRIDIVLTDIVMPGGASGLDLARAVRQQYGEDLPVILATGYSDKAQTAADEGFPILRKPFDGATLHGAITEAIQKLRSRQAG